MLKLSKYQQNILKLVKERDLLLCSSEGKHYRCWLANKDGELILKVRIDSAEQLVKNKVFIIMEDNEYPEYFKNKTIFCWKLSKL